MQQTQTPWGRATVVEEVAAEQQVPEKGYDALVQLLELKDGEQLVRFGARAHGARRLSCLTVRAEDLELLEEGMLETERLAAVLRLAFG